jgi:outer membrane receptor protein involved in Fe transport
MKLLSGIAVAATLGLPAAALTQTVPAPPPTTLPEVEVIAPTPLLGSGVDRNTVPAETQVLTGKDVTLYGPPNALQALQDQAQGVQLDNAAGNPFQPQLVYHGFQASALQGTAQGLAVYVNGMRFNQPFGDTVNWDLIPDIAIDRINVEGANPVFGLNALGGSISVQLRNGFTYHGGEVDAYGGSFGQVAGTFQYGRQSGDVAVYVAGTGLHENGWRTDQSSGLKQFYGDIGWRGDSAELHFNISLAQNNIDGPGTAPIQLLQADPSAMFTGPNAIANDYLRMQLAGNYDISDTTSVQAMAYYTNFLQRVANGNGSPLIACGEQLCESPGVVATDRSGNPIPAFLGPDGLYGSIANQTTNSNGYGASVQLSNSGRLLGLHNNLVVGASFDGAQTLFDANTQIGGLDPITRNYLGPGITIDLVDGSIIPVRADIADNYYGVFFTDTLDLTQRLSLNVAGRFNAADIGITDLMGGPLTGNHVYNRFNPSAGLTYKILPHLSVYADYAESNRAPTPAELTCNDPASPCSLANFFTGDPALKQVVARSVEFGVRGRATPSDGTRIDWNIGLYRSDLQDDIIFAQSPTLGAGFFQNVGATQRQGLDAGLRVTAGPWLAWANYSYTDATFLNGFLESSPYNPGADANGNITIHPGDHMPGIPTHLVKLGVQYQATDAWTVGVTAVAASGQYLFGDEANLTPKLPGYVVLDLNTSYQVTKNVQVFAMAQNLLNATYYTYGTFSPTTSVPLVQAPGASNPRSYNIAAPVAAYGGVKVTF